jgi:hypothetical protein
MKAVPPPRLLTLPRADDSPFICRAHDRPRVDLCSQEAPPVPTMEQGEDAGPNGWTP